MGLSLRLTGCNYCRPSHTAAVALVGLWCQPSLPFGCVFCGPGWVLLWCNLKQAPGFVDSGGSWERLWCRPRSATPVLG